MRVKIFERCESTVVLTAYLRHVKLHNGFSAISPAISVGKILRNDSPIFTIVKRGDVNELKRLLMRREGTLRDRDSRGTPLLHVRDSHYLQVNCTYQKN